MGSGSHRYDPRLFSIRLIFLQVYATTNDLSDYHAQRYAINHAMHPRRCPSTASAASYLILSLFGGTGFLATVPFSRAFLSTPLRVCRKGRCRPRPPPLFTSGSDGEGAERQYDDIPFSPPVSASESSSENETRISSASDTAYYGDALPSGGNSKTLQDTLSELFSVASSGATGPGDFERSSSSSAPEPLFPADGRGLPSSSVPEPLFTVDAAGRGAIAMDNFIAEQLSMKVGDGDGEGGVYLEEEEYLRLSRGGFVSADGVLSPRDVIGGDQYDKLSESLISPHPPIPPEYLSADASPGASGDVERIDPEELHRMVFEGEEAYLNQSESFRRFLSGGSRMASGVGDGDDQSGRDDEGQADPDSSDAPKSVVKKEVNAEADIPYAAVPRTEPTHRSEQDEALGQLLEDLSSWEENLDPSLGSPSPGNPTTNPMAEVGPDKRKADMKCSGCNASLSPYEMRRAEMGATALCLLCNSDRLYVPGPDPIEKFSRAEGPSTKQFRGWYDYGAEEEEIERMSSSAVQRGSSQPAPPRSSQQKNRMRPINGPMENMGQMSSSSVQRGGSLPVPRRSFQRKNNMRPTGTPDASAGGSIREGDSDRVVALTTKVQSLESLLREYEAELKSSKREILRLKETVRSLEDELGSIGDKGRNSEGEKVIDEKSWVPMKDPMTSEVFYWNESTGEMRWDL